MGRRTIQAMEPSGRTTLRFLNAEVSFSRERPQRKRPPASSVVPSGAVGWGGAVDTESHAYRL